MTGGACYWDGGFKGCPHPLVNSGCPGLHQEAMRFFVIGLFCYFISTILVLSLVLSVTFTCMSVITWN